MIGNSQIPTLKNIMKMMIVTAPCVKGHFNALQRNVLAQDINFEFLNSIVKCYYLI